MNPSAGSLSSSAIVIDAAELHGYAAALLARVGFSSPDADELAAALVEADLRGLPSHGVLHLPNWVRRTRLGLVRPASTVRTLAESASTARLDGQHGPGMLIAARAMDVAIRKGRATGVAAVAVTNSTHFGIGALHAERAAHAGLIGIALSNATPMLPAPGGAQRLLGTNPIAIAVPGDDGTPSISLDMGLGQVTMGFVRACMQRGEALPAGVAAAPDGLPTTDPARALADGFLLPTGGHRGFGLALAVEVLAGVLSGAGVGPEVGSLFADYDRPQRTGHFLLALNPCHFLPPDELAARMGRLRRWIKESARAAGAGPVHLPGERAQATARDYRVHGIPLSPETAAALVQLGRECQVPLSASLAATAT